MPWDVRNDHADCSGYAVVDDAGAVVPGGCHKTKRQAQAQQRALYANAEDAGCLDPATFTGHFEQFEVDNSPWDASAAMARCASSDTPGSCYQSICAGRKSGPADRQASWALPHHKTAGGPPNAGGVRNALSRLGQTEGLSNAGAARRHLDAHLAAIRGDREEDAAVTTTAQVEVEELAGKAAQPDEQGNCPPDHRKMPNGICLPTATADSLTPEQAAAFGGPPNQGTPADRRKTENKSRKRRTKMAGASKVTAGEDGSWEGILVIEGIPTGDGREFALDSLSWADLPLPLTYQPPSHGGDPGPGFDVGRIDEVWRDEGDRRVIRARGVFDLEDEHGANAYRKVREKFLRGLSIDADDIDPMTDVELVWPEGFEDLDGPEALFVPPSRRIFHKARMRGAALLSMPAYVEAQMWTADADPPELPELEGLEDLEHELEKELDGMVAAALGLDNLDWPKPPREWFQDPRLGVPVPITITADGRVYGHAATWDTCHVGYGDRCVQPPREEGGFPYFTQGEVLCADGSRVPVGQVTVDTGHANLSVNWRAASAHYDNTGTAVADVAVGNDEHGIWVAGWIRPDAPPAAVAALRASGQVSGDWRRVGGSLRLVGLLGVNVPGFPVPRPQARVASGMEVALVAAGQPSFARSPIDRDMDERALRQLRDKTLDAILAG